MWQEYYKKNRLRQKYFQQSKARMIFRNHTGFFIYTYFRFEKRIEVGEKKTQHSIGNLVPIY